MEARCVVNYLCFKKKGLNFWHRLHKFQDWSRTLHRHMVQVIKAHRMREKRLRIDEDFYISKCYWVNVVLNLVFNDSRFHTSKISAWAWTRNRTAVTIAQTGTVLQMGFLFFSFFFLLCNHNSMSGTWQTFKIVCDETTWVNQANWLNIKAACRLQFQRGGNRTKLKHARLISGRQKRIHEMWRANRKEKLTNHI